jgi:shikimate dehydrogenase
MKNYLVIGSPIEHSLSPKLHNYWIKKNNINAVYEKRKLTEDEIKNFILEIRKKKIDGANVTVPFKKKVIPFLDKLSLEASSTQSVNTIYLDGDKVVGHNTDIVGFEKSILDKKYDVQGKRALILGAGGVVSSIIFVLKKLNTSEIILSNRTKNNIEYLKKMFENLKVVDWGEFPNFDIIINATSLGLNEDDNIIIDFSKLGKNKFFYDVIYNPKQTNFLKKAKEMGNTTENGKMMFIYQAQKSFEKWHNILPEIDDEVLDLLDD